MKKHLFTLAALVAALAFTKANAQFELAANTKKAGTALIAGNAFADTKAYQKFHKAFPASEGESWIQTKEGFSVVFTVKGIMARAYLSRKGNVDGLIRYYHEDNLPQDVRQTVKNEYANYAITLVQEVTYNGITAYLVIVEDKTTWKILRVVDGEMDVRSEYVKAQ